MRITTCFGDRTCGTFLGLSDEDDECFQQCYFSSCTLLPLRFALPLNNISGLSNIMIKTNGGEGNVFEYVSRKLALIVNTDFFVAREA